jgi:hypothetical protein
VREIGGSGGRGTGGTHTGGAGGVASNETAAASGFNARATARQTGGAGGYGASGATGGAGAASTLTNDVSGTTKGGYLQLYQIATGGGGGFSSSAAGGAGGKGTSNLTFNDVTANVIDAATFTATSTANGGAGGSSGGGLDGASGGAAVASVTATGAHAVTTTATANGGAGGSGTHVGAGGDATATSTAVGVSTVNSHATATGGGGGGDALADATATGNTGTIGATANASQVSGSLVRSVQTTASGQVSGTSTMEAHSTIGGSTPAFATGDQGIAVATGSPAQSSVTPVLTANSNIAAAFATSPTFFAMGELGGHYSQSGAGTQTVTDTINLSIDLTQLASRHDLQIGFFSGQQQGSGFSSLHITVVADGVTVLDQTFASPAAATTFFTNHAIDLGSLSSGALSGNTLTLAITETLVVTGSGQGYYEGLLIGDAAAGSGPVAPHTAVADTHAGGGDSFDYSAAAVATKATPAIPAPVADTHAAAVIHDSFDFSAATATGGSVVHDSMAAHADIDPSVMTLLEAMHHLPGDLHVMADIQALIAQAFAAHTHPVFTEVF